MVSPCSPGLVPLCVPSYFPILDGVSAFLKPCLPSYFPLLDGASALSRSCPLLSPLVPPCFPLSSRMCAPHVCLCCVTAFPRSCLPLSFFLPTSVPVLDGASAFRRSCLRLSPIEVSPFVCLCLDGMTHWSPIVLPTYVPALDFRGLASACLSLSPRKCACPGWCVRFPEVLSRMVFLLASLCWMVCPLSRLVSPCFLCLPLPPIVCHGLPTCESAFPRSCLPLCPFLFPFVGWCVCRPLALDYLPLSPFLFPFVGWCAFPRTCPPCPPACLPACQIVFFLLVPFGVRLPEALAPLSPLPVCLPACFPFLDGARVFPRPCLPACLPVCFCSCFPLFDGASAFPRLCLSFP